MNIQLAEAIILQTGIKIALQHRFAFDTGTILRLENDAMVNVFDDGRYYIQGENTQELTLCFGRVEVAWDPETWTCGAPKATPPSGATMLPSVPLAPSLSSADQKERLDF